MNFFLSIYLFIYLIHYSESESSKLHQPINTLS